MNNLKKYKPEIIIDKRPQCNSLGHKYYKHGAVPCVKEKGHSGLHEWIGGPMGKTILKWKK